jgi:hypothetical protein
LPVLPYGLRDERYFTRAGQCAGFFFISANDLRTLALSTMSWVRFTGSEDTRCSACVFFEAINNLVMKPLTLSVRRFVTDVGAEDARRNAARDKMMKTNNTLFNM